MIKEFITKNWYIVLPWFCTIALFSHIVVKHWISEPIPPHPPLPPDNRLDSLQQVVNNLNANYNKLKHNYDSAQANIKTEIEYIYIKNAKDVSNIHNYTLDQRDSMWSTLNP